MGIGLKREEILYYVGYALYIFAISFLTNVFPSISQLVRILAICMMLVAAIYEMRSFEKSIIFRYIFIAVIVAYLGLKFKSVAFLACFVFLYAFKNCSIDKLIKIDFGVRLFGFLGTSICCLFGIAVDNILYTYRSSGELSVRHTFGYVHPNTCFLMIFVLLVDYLLLRHIYTSKIKFLDVCVTLVIAFIFEHFTNSRAGFLLIILFVIAFYLESKFKVLEKMKWLTKCMCYSAPIGLILSMVLVVVYEKMPVLGNMLNQLFTKRLSSMSYFFQQYGISIWGQITKRVSTSQALETGERALVLDNFYANLLIVYGLVFTIIYLFLHVRTSHYLVKKERYDLLIVLTVISIYGLVEGIALNVDYNYFIVLFGVVIFSKHKSYFLIENEN